MASRRSMRTAAVVASLTVGLLLALACGSLAAEEEAGDRIFSYPRSAEVEVLRVTYSGGNAMGVSGPRYSLYGDGRLEVKIEGYHQGASGIKDSTSLYLTRGEVRDLIGLLVSNHVLECDDPCLRQNFLATLGHVPRPADGVTMHVVLRLDNYDRGAGEPISNFVYETSIHSPGIALYLFERAGRTPFPELYGLATLQRRLNHLWKLAGNDS